MIQHHKTKWVFQRNDSDNGPMPQNKMSLSTKWFWQQSNTTKYNESFNQMILTMVQHHKTQNTMRQPKFLMTIYLRQMHVTQLRILTMFQANKDPAGSNMNNELNEHLLWVHLPIQLVRKRHGNDHTSTKIMKLLNIVESAHDCIRRLPENLSQQRADLLGTSNLHVACFLIKQIYHNGHCNLIMLHSKLILEPFYVLLHRIMTSPDTDTSVCTH